MEVESEFVVQFWLLYILFYLWFSWEVIFYFFKVMRNKPWKHVPVVKSTFIVLVCNPGTVSWNISSLPTGILLSFVSRGCWREHCKRKGFFFLVCWYFPPSCFLAVSLHEMGVGGSRSSKLTSLRVSASSHKWSCALVGDFGLPVTD